MEIITNNPYFPVSALSLLNFILWMILFWQFRKYQKRQDALLTGEDGANLQEIVLKQKKTLASHAKILKELGKILEELVERNELNIQKIGLVRFNPFADTGGNMSFSLALLDGGSNGIVISSLYSREGTRIYTKPIKNSESSYHLTEEEKEAISQANQKLI